ncbi:WW domain-containing oxidoreductase [Auricularia subglabra TFB-10046 SS5]|nr:WW domain-containing oxidoreductase [Auricularia subglabra TFB-10046 SS5]
MSPSFRFESTGDEVVAAFPDQVKGRIFLVTGPTPNGIGESTALSLAKAKPEAIILAGRTPAGFKSVADAVVKLSPSTRVISVQLDLSSQASIRCAASELLANPAVPRIDVLINNAGIMATLWGTTAEGIEQQFGTNHIGHFLLTSLLLPKLLASSSPRVVNLTSSGHRLGKNELFEDYNYQKTPYEPWQGYGQSKLANVHFSTELARRHPQIKAYSVHPGSISTNLSRHITTERAAERDALVEKVKNIPNWETLERKTVEQGCSTTLVAALTPNLEPNGAYLSEGQVGNPQDATKDAEAARKLWELSEKLVGAKFGENKN